MKKVRAALAAFMFTLSIWSCLSSEVLGQVIEGGASRSTGTRRGSRQPTQPPNRPATGGGSSSKTKAQADELLRRGITYKDGDETKSNASVRQDESNATLEETLNWLKAQLVKHGSFTGEGLMLRNQTVKVIRTFEPINFGSCTLMWRESADSTGTAFQDHYLTEIEVTLPLIDLNPDSIQFKQQNSRDTLSFGGYDGSILIKTSNAKESIKLKWTNTQILDNNQKGQAKTEYYLKESWHLTFVTNDSDIGNRMVKAIRHAIILCGGKKEPFYMTGTPRYGF